MRITKIEIQNYKSIKKTIEVRFYDDLPTILIGKNGSGKTNILEALNAIAEANSNYYGLNKDLSLIYKVHISLSKKDIAQLFLDKEIDENKCHFIAYSGERCKIDRIESEYLVPLLKFQVCEINNLASELKDAFDLYTKQLNKIAYSEMEELSLRGFQITDFKNSTTNYNRLKYQIDFILEQVEKLAESIKKNFVNEEHSFKFGCVYNYYQSDNLKKLPFKLYYMKPELAPFEEKFITVNETALKREITKINRATKESCDKITGLLKKLDDHAKRLKDALTSEQLMPDSSGILYQFIREMQKCVGTQCLFLRNESSDVIFKSDERNQEYYSNDNSFVILKTYLNKVYRDNDKEELLKQIQVNKDFPLSDEAMSEFEEYLNANIPEFENGMYEHISVEHSSKKIPTILLHEKSGETIALNSTSAGRRWYFTYYFMKNTLETGDFFIIDEPAAMLHPIAQKEVLNELFELRKLGIRIVYSTHSPYLVPNEWKSVHFVHMDDGGTSVTQENQYIRFKQVMGEDIFNLQELLEKYKKCGNINSAYNCYIALMEKYGSIEEASKNIPFSYDTIESWKKKKRGTSFENVIFIANKIDISLEKLL